MAGRPNKRSVLATVPHRRDPVILIQRSIPESLRCLSSAMR